MLGHVILISAQVQSNAGVPVLEAVTFGAFAEVQRGASAGVSVFRRAWSGYVGLRHVNAENDALKTRLADLQVELQEQQALADRSRGLQQLLDLTTELNTMAAEITAAATPDFRTVTSTRDRKSGIKADMAVIAPAGVVGRGLSRARARGAASSIARRPAPLSSARARRARRQGAHPLLMQCVS
jgi:rod shape-determining protein MreC